MSRKTSYMKVCYKPKRHGYEIVDIFYGEARVRRSQTVAMTGDVLRDVDGGLWVLEGSMNDEVFVHPLTDDR